MLKMLDLFSGIDGFSLAARWTGQIETVTFVEIDKFCQKVLDKNFPGVPIIDDIREVTGERIRGIVADTARKLLNGSGDTRPARRDEYTDSHIDILTGGFPCQPFSCAGKRAGTADNRFLWPEMLRLISEVKPTWVIGENVRGLLSIDDGMVFEDCCASLEALGYEVQSFVIPACAVNAPHRRDRMWIVARSINRGSQERWAETDREMERSYDGRKTPLHFGAEVEKSDHYAPDTRDEGLQRGERTGAYDEGQAAHGPIAECHSAWHEAWYTVALRTCIRRVDDGVSSELDELGRVSSESVVARKKDKTSAGRVHRLKALGNAIVPQVVYPIFQAIVEIEREGK